MISGFLMKYTVYNECVYFWLHVRDIFADWSRLFGRIYGQVSRLDVGEGLGNCLMS